MNILVPLAGKDEGFITEYHDLKFFMDICGKPLISMMLQCLPFNLDRLIFITLKEYEKRFDVSERLKSLFGSSISIVITEKLTEGSACSTLLAAKWIDNSKELLIDLADVYFDPLDMKEYFQNRREDISGIIPVCSGRVMDRPWGYVYKDGDGNVIALKEKEINPISNFATLGLYHFSKGREFIKYGKEMIKRNMRVLHNNLFYVGPLYNVFIEHGHRVSTCNVNIKYVFGNLADFRNYKESLNSRRKDD